MAHLKILWFNWRCWLNPAMGGAEVFTREVASRWVKNGNDLTLFTSTFAGCKKEEVSEGVTIIRSGGRFNVYNQAKKFYDCYFKNQHFDVVIDEINTRPFFCPKYVRNGETVIALIHQLAKEFWFYEVPFPASYIGYYLLEDYWLKQYANMPTFTVSKSTSDDLLNLGFKNITILPEGLNFDPLIDLPVKETKPIMAFSGRLKRAKRPDHAIEAFKLLKKRIPQSELWIFGDGPYRKKLEVIAGPDVRFFGNLPTANRLELIKSCWILLVPGVREGWGLNVTEANALGTPAVAYDVPGLRDSIKNGKTGLLVKAGDITSLANAAISLSNNPVELQSLSYNALNYSKSFKWDNTANEFMNKINKILEVNE
jgi:glycosyltransferase involved in cell wall biosynthesis